MIIFLNSQKDNTSFADKVNNNKCKKTKKKVQQIQYSIPYLMNRNALILESIAATENVFLSLDSHTSFILQKIWWFYHTAIVLKQNLKKRKSCQVCQSLHLIKS